MPRSGYDVLVVGLGEVARTHLAVLEQFPGIDVVAGVDPARRAEITFRGKLIPVYRTVRDAHGAHQPDVVVIATPTPTHAAVCDQTAECFPDARLLMEKPAAATLTGVGRVLDEIGRRQQVEVAYHMSFSPEVTWGVELVRAWADVLGVPVAIEAFFADPYTDDFQTAQSRYCSSWVDSGINALSVINRFSAPVERRWLRELGAAHESVFEANLVCQTGDATVPALVLTSWHVSDPAKNTRIRYASGAELVLDHTAVAGYLVQDGTVRAVFGSDRSITRRDRHYLALYRWWLVDNRPILPPEVSLRLHDLLLRPPDDGWTSASAGR